MGYIKATVNVTLAQISVSDYDLKTYLDNFKNVYLTVLPKNTEYLRTIQGNVFGTYLPVTLFFEHPFFEDNSTVEIGFRRQSKFVDQGTLQERLLVTDFITEVRYLKPDGSPLF